MSCARLVAIATPDVYLAPSETNWIGSEGSEENKGALCQTKLLLLGRAATPTTSGSGSKAQLAPLFWWLPRFCVWTI